MEISKFKEKIGKLTPPWEMTNSAIWCPIYMEPKSGYWMMGGKWKEDQLEDFWTEIVNHNRRIRVHEDYVELPIEQSNTYIKIKRNGK